MPPPRKFQPNLIGFAKPGICFFQNQENFFSIFASDRSRTSILSEIIEVVYQMCFLLN